MRADDIAERLRQAAVRSAQTNFELSEAEFKRYKDLRDQNFISSLELERREAALKAAIQPDADSAGALAYLVKPYQKSDLIPAIEVAIGRFRELQQLSGEVDSLGEQLEARKSIDRAKGVLIDECGLKESEAFTFIQRTAMSERSRMRDVAERILDGSLRP